MPCRMTQRSAFSHPLPPPPLCSPEFQPGLSQRLRAPVPLGQPCGSPTGPCTAPTPPCRRPPRSAQPREPSAHRHLQRHLGSPDPLGACGARCLLPYWVSPRHAAHGMRHAARGSMRALTIEGISAASLPQGVTTSCSRRPQKLAGAPGTPICRVPAVQRAPSCWPPPAPAAYQLPSSNPAPLIGNGCILPNLAKALLAKSCGLNVGLKLG